MRVLTEVDLSGLLSPMRILAAVEEAARTYASSRAKPLMRQHFEWCAGTCLVMPVVGPQSVGVKVVSVVPGNSMRKMPVTNGLMVLNDRETGLPMAILNASSLTAQRTGAVGALGVKYMTPPDLDSVGIIGTGMQGTWQAIFACATRPIKEVFYVSRSSDGAERFAHNLSQCLPETRLTQCADARALLHCTSLVITATTSIEPVLPDEPQLLENKHFISIGSFRPSMQELPLSVFKLSGALAIDSEAAHHEVGDVIRPLAEGVLSTANVFHIADLVTGRRDVDTASTTAYKSVGMALYDVYVAQAFYDAALIGNIGREIDL
jgi:ornithine cyclodeaminase/alanine dehydrogenase-like protein (mu-crystallin family)